MKRYGEYKPVTSRWVKQLPLDWDFQKIADVFIERKEINDPIKTTDILSLTNTRGVIPYSEKGNIGNKSKSDLKGYHLAYPGDIVLNSMNVIIGSVGLTQYFGAVSPVYYVLFLRNKDTCNIRYFDYVFRDKVFQGGLKGLGNGILEIRMRIPMSKLKYVCVPIPPRTEQDQIVRYLDWQVSKINRLIAAKRKEISLMHEYRGSVIDEIVLHGTCVNEKEKKVSGIEGLGNVPATWEILPLKRVCQVNAPISSMLNGMYDDEMVTFLPMESISVRGEVDYSIRRKLSEVKSGYSSFAKNDVVIAKITPCFENYKGACLDSLQTSIGYGTTEFINLRATPRILPKFLYMITMTRLFRKKGEEVMTGSAGQKRVPLDFVKNFPAGIPPIDVQRELLQYLDKALKRIDEQTNLFIREINILQELRTRLITDVVTGQVDVRDIEVPDFPMTQLMPFDNILNEKEFLDDEERQVDQ